MPESFIVATQDQVQEVYRLSAGLREDDTDEIEKRLSLANNDAKQRGIILASGDVRTPLLPVEDLDTFYLIHKPGQVITVTREKGRPDIGAGYSEQTWMHLMPNIFGVVKAENNTRIVPGEDPEESKELMDLDEFIEYATFIGHSQLDVVTDKLCDDLIRQLGATVVWR